MNGPSSGQVALREAARLEAARVYGNVTTPASSEPFSVFAARAEAELQAALDRRSDRHNLDALIAQGVSSKALVDDYGFTYGQVRAARKHTMKNGAA